MKAKGRPPHVLDAFTARAERSAIAALNQAAQRFDVVRAEDDFALCFQLNPQGLAVATVVTQSDGIGPAVVLNAEQLQEVADKLQKLAALARLRRLAAVSRSRRA